MNVTKGRLIAHQLFGNLKVGALVFAAYVIHLAHYAHVQNLDEGGRHVAHVDEVATDGRAVHKVGGGRQGQGVQAAKGDQSVSSECRLKGMKVKEARRKLRYKENQLCAEEGGSGRRRIRVPKGVDSHRQIELKAV